MDFQEHARSLLTELDARGMERTDAAVAVHLSWAIVGLELHLFPGELAPVMLMDFVHERDSVQYRLVGDREEYALYVPGLYQQMRLECLTTILDNAHLAPPRDVPVPTLLENIMGLAVHEVRHRVQFRRRDTLRRWLPGTSADGMTGALLRRVRASGRWRVPAPAMEAALPAPYEELEFDAQFVQFYALHRMDALETPAELAQIALLEPPAAP